MNEPMIGKIYSHVLGGLVQIIDITDNRITAYSLNNGYLIENFNWRSWKNRCKTKTSHSKMMIPCLDCQKFCRQLCQVLN